MGDEKTILTTKEALDTLTPDGDVHVFRNPGGMLVGADWSRKEILKLLSEATEIQVGGETCVSMGHGLVVTSGGQFYFLESTAGKSPAKEK